MITPYATVIPRSNRGQYRSNTAVNTAVNTTVSTLVNFAVNGMLEVVYFCYVLLH